MRPVVAEIRTAALRRNYARLRSAVCFAAAPDALTLAVVKANAYGHGLALCARALVEEGAPWLGVTSVDEAMELRHAIGSASARVLVMSGFFPGEEGLLLRHGMTPMLWEPWHFSMLDAAARRAGLPPASLPVHVEIDTGMGRQGVAPGEPLAHVLRSAGAADSSSPLFIEGTLTHFSSPESALAAGCSTPAQPSRQPLAKETTLAAQLGRFHSALRQLHEAGVRPRLVHAGSTVNAMYGVGLPELAVLARSMNAVAMARTGLALYGCGPTLAHRSLEFEPVLRWRTEITTLRTLEPGQSVGYSETFKAARPTRIALLPVGYADGVDRALSGRGQVLVRGCRAPIVGRVSMDQTTLDVTEVPGAALGDEVVLLGSQQQDAIPAEELAMLSHTIPYEVICRIGARVPRIAVEEHPTA